MKQCQSGLILLMTLLLLGVVSALIVTQLEMVLLHQKATKQVIERQQLRQNLEQLAQQILISSSSQRQSNCTIAAYQNPNQVIAQLKMKRACILTKDKSNYIYLIEDLGVEPCLQTMVHDVRYSAKHRRLTIASDGEASDYLQIVVAELTDFRPCAMQQKIRRIMPGFVSWRFWTGN